MKTYTDVREFQFSEPLHAYWFNGGIHAKSANGNLVIKCPWSGPFAEPKGFYLGDEIPCCHAQKAIRFLSKMACKNSGFTLGELKKAAGI